jgi:hypothetical protein
MLPNGFTEQSSMKSDFPLPILELRYGKISGDAKCSDAIKYRGMNLDFSNLTVEVTRRQGLTD